MKPNNRNIFQCFNFETATTPSEEEVIAHFKRFLRNSSEDLLAEVLHYCTGSAMIDPSEKVKVIFLDQDCRNHFIGAKACFKMLYFPKKIQSFSLFKDLFEKTLREPNNWVMED